MRIHHRLFLSAAWCATAVVAPQARGALIFNTNVILNPGAEAGPGALTNNITEPVPNWTLSAGNFTAVQYTTIANSVPRFTDPGPPNRGTNFFAGGANRNPDAPAFLSIGDQILDISNQASLIDTGTVAFALSAYLGGYFDQRDNAMFSAIFENAASAVIATSTVGPVLLADRFDPASMQSITELLLRSTNGVIPVGTRQIDFRLTLTGIDGNQNDGYADNLSFIATGPGTVPEPGSMGMLGLGLCGFAWSMRRRRK